MYSKLLTLGALGVALVSTPALAQHGNHGGGGMHGGAGIGLGLGGGPMLQDRGSGIDVRTQARINSQADLRASDRARLRANANSAVRADDDVTSELKDATRNYATRVRPTTASRARVNSQGSIHASARAHARANARSAVRTRTTPHRTAD